MPTVYDDDSKICEKCKASNDIDAARCFKCKAKFKLPKTRIVMTEWGPVERKVKPK